MGENTLLAKMQEKKNELKSERPFNDEFCRGFAFAMEFVKAQPEVMEWIPVSERLPEEAGEYLVCNRIHTYKAFFDGEDFMSIWAVPMPCVEAWRPLPEPYKGE